MLLREGLEFIGTQVRETIQFIAFLEVKMIVTLFYETLFRRCIEMFAAQNKTGMVSDRIKKKNNSNLYGIMVVINHSELLSCWFFLTIFIRSRG